MSQTSVRGKVFANAQTGNIVLLSQSIAEKNWHLALHYLVPLVFFAFGIAFSEFVHIKYRKIQKFHWRQLVVFNEIILLFVVGFLPLEWNLLANAIVSFSCAMQVQAFRKVNGYAFASTMCIGNMRSGVESLCAYVKTKDKKILHKSLCYWAIIIMFPVCALANTFPRNMYVYASCRPPETDKNAAVKNESDICPCILCFILYSSVKCFLGNVLTL